MKLFSFLSLIRYMGFIILPFLFLACKNDLNEIIELDTSTEPDIIITSPIILRSSYGNVEVKVEATLAKRFLSKSVKTEFPEGIFITFFDDDKSIKSTLKANYATSRDNDNIMTAQNDVVIIDFKKGDTIYTEEIIWDQFIQKIYSHKAVKSVNGSEVTYGDGFEMDEVTGTPTIYHQRGTLKWNDE